MDLSPLPITHPAHSLNRRDKRPIYLMIKPPAPTQREIAHRRQMLGIESGYGPERFHITLLPIEDARFISPSRMELLLGLLASFQAEPFEVGFIRLKGNALRGGKALRALRRFQKSLAELLLAAGLDVSGYAFEPHLSLSYGNWQPRNIPVSPICWRVEEFKLIKSIHGQGRHEELGRWPLISRQGSFVF